MTPEQRRDTIVRAALPLLAEHGAAVTTAQIARAAGIGEATIFRVFEDKDAMLEACIAAVLDPENLLRQLRSIDIDQPLSDRLVEAVDALDAHFGRVGAVLGALHASGTPNRRPRPRTADVGEPRIGTAGVGESRTGTAGVGESPTGTPNVAELRTGAAELRTDTAEVAEPRTPSAGRDAARAATRQATLELFAPDRDRLRLPAETVTDAFLALFSVSGRIPRHHQRVPTAELIDLFLNGAVSRQESVEKP